MQRGDIEIIDASPMAEGRNAPFLLIYYTDNSTSRFYKSVNILLTRELSANIDMVDNVLDIITDSHLNSEEITLEKLIEIFKDEPRILTKYIRENNLNKII